MPVFWFLWKGMEEAGKAGKLANLNNFSGLPGIGADPSCLVPGCGVIKTEEY